MRTSTLAAIVVIILAIIGLGYWYYVQAPTMPAPAGDTASDTLPEGSEGGGPADTDAPAGPGAMSFTMVEVAAHASASSCYTVIDGEVYDLTNWIAQHPGGAGAILKLCGQDGTATFRAQHSTAQRQADVLAGFKIGTLAE